MNALTTHLIVKEHDTNIARALESLSPLGGTLLVADVGCQNDTYRLCARYGAKLIRLSLDHDYAKVRNEMVLLSKTGWQFYMEPWELLLSGHDDIKGIATAGAGAYRIQCVQGDVMTKQVRLWHKDSGVRFQNPFYETLNTSGVDVGATILVENVNRCREAHECIARWKERAPLAVEPYYYDACTLLAERKWDEFLRTADHYLFHEANAGMSVTMTRYYVSVVQVYIKKDYRSALRNVISCLAAKPTMAEFWCLLGDIYYAKTDYARAREFYENAHIMGSRRLRGDDWPVEIPKYGEYPKKMQGACQERLQKQLRISCTTA